MHVKKAAIIGIGKTGLATAAFLAKQGIDIAVTDEKPPAQWGDALTFLKNLPVELTIAPYGPEILADVDLVVPSPGVYPGNPILAEAVRSGIDVLSELELASRFLKTPMIAITGTNGKTTTTSLLGAILRQAGKKVFVGGNIGEPLIGYVAGPQDADWAVIEVSSFQLQWVREFHPAIALLLNVTPDHLDYHGNLTGYREIKERIFARQTSEDLAILNGTEAALVALGKRLTAQTEFFCYDDSFKNNASEPGTVASQAVISGMFRDKNILVHILPDGKREEYPVGMIKIPGKHNLENVMAAIMAARGCGCPSSDIITAVKEFRGLPHRIEYILEKNGIRFYDDSKGTNVDAVLRAIESFSEPLILLLGGRDKEGDFETLIPSLRKNVKETVLFGEASEKINRLIGKKVKTTMQKTLNAALLAAFEHAAPGDVVLLSPGCASFDEFKNYKDRGNRFQEWVKQL
ncbi:MAG: UDP-N-acetylmuramoyl-L-alanine--D-glutamate ligase [Syntrophobacterales bacterium]|nr:UDP-N-acetylmuramoyl-L-alanine--D-glutamate ligase [Syntrophobacterales bacterium]